LGRFTSRDPLGGVTGTSTVADSYAYASNDPVNRVDPLGLRSSDSQFGFPGFVMVRGVDNGGWLAAATLLTQEGVDKVFWEMVSRLTPAAPVTAAGPTWGMYPLVYGLQPGTITAGGVVVAEFTLLVVESQLAVDLAELIVQTEMESRAAAAYLDELAAQSQIVQDSRTNIPLDANGDVTSMTDDTPQPATSGAGNRSGNGGTCATSTASPVGEILRQDGVKIVIYSNDHAPPHAHVVGGGTETRIGQNGKPLAGDPELTRKQQNVVDDNINTIRDAVGAYMRWYRENC
jgi:hypothetical protein